MRLAILAVVASLFAAGAFQPEASVRGCLSDSLSQPLNAGWITITGPDVERHVVADAQGCYRADALPAGTYLVRAAVPGFCDGLRKDLAIGPGQLATANFTLVLAPMFEEVVSYPWTGWPDVARRVDAIVYLRVLQILDTHAWPSDRCDSHIAAEVITSVMSAARLPNESAVTGGRLRFLWNPSHLPSRTPQLAAGETFVAFLQWVPSASRLMLTNAGFLVPVRDGKLSWVAGNDRTSDGKDVTAFLAEMRRLPGRVTP